MFTILKGLKILGRHLKKSWWSQIIRVIILRFEEHIQLSTLECFLLFLFGIKQYLSNIYTAVYSQLSKFLSLHFFHKVTYTIFNPLSNPITFFLCSFYVSLFFFKITCYIHWNPCRLSAGYACIDYPMSILCQIRHPSARLGHAMPCWWSFCNHDIPPLFSLL